MTLSSLALGAKDARPSRSPSMMLTCALFFITWLMMLLLYRQPTSLPSEFPKKLASQISALMPTAAPAPAAPKAPPPPASKPVVAPRPGTLEARRLKVNLKEIWMDDVEVDLVLHYLGGVDKYLEWGSGGSTINFARFAQKRAVSIEHSRAWCAMMPKRIQKAQIRPVELRCVENSTSFAAEGNYRQFRAYVDEISKLNEPVWDFVLVDGRCRVGAAIKALSYISQKSVVVLHDSARIFRDGALYRPVLDYYDVVDSIGGLRRRGVCILRRKKNLNYLQGQHAKVQEILEKVFREARYR